MRRVTYKNRRLWLLGTTLLIVALALCFTSLITHNLLYFWVALPFALAGVCLNYG